MKAMILAAGLGTRLLPYTLKRPKPLFPVLNTPLLHLTISRIRKAGFSEIIVNAHHLREQIKEALEDESACFLQEEETVLGTGGGLRKALVHFADEPVLVVNGDIYHTIDYQEAYRDHAVSGADVTLVLHDYPRFNSVTVDSANMVASFLKAAKNCGPGERLLAFTGIHIINPRVLQAIPAETPSCIIDCYKNLLQRGGTIRALIKKDHFWTDMGTPEDYLGLHAGLLKQTIPVYEELAGVLSAAPFVVQADGCIPDSVTLLDWACVGKGASIGGNSTIERSVVWENAVVPPDSVIRDAIVID